MNSFYELILTIDRSFCPKNSNILNEIKKLKFTETIN